VFAAIAAVSGTLGTNVGCNPSRPVAVLAAHGTADPIVPFDGGAMRGRGGASDIVSAPAMVDRWRAADGCQGAPAAETLPSAGDGTVVRRVTSTPCAAGTAVVFYQVDDGGHTWPGGPNTSQRRSSDQPRTHSPRRKPLDNSSSRTPADATQPVRTVNKSETLAEIASPARPSDRRAQLPPCESC